MRPGVIISATLCNLDDIFTGLFRKSILIQIILKPVSYTHLLTAKGIEFEEVTSLDEVMPKLDILYMTRVQKERFFNEEEYLRMKDYYILTREKMALAKEDMIVLHPLPRVNEISVEVDDDPRAAYFRCV